MSNERVALAQELHDGIAQDLVALGFSIDAIISTAESKDSKSSLRDLRFTVTDLIEKLRREIHALHNGDELIDSAIDTDVTHELQRIFTEIIRNVQEHSEASSLDIEVSDNGIGGAAPRKNSFGLTDIQERTKNLNGEIQIDSNEKGTRIRIHIPLDR
ncbi:HATPase_UhpB-NarQ-NarX-like domain containing protein [Candidatus Nanopelagicaceae bacterium]